MQEPPGPPAPDVGAHIRHLQTRVEAVETRVEALEVARVEDRAAMNAGLLRLEGALRSMAEQWNGVAGRLQRDFAHVEAVVATAVNSVEASAREVVASCQDTNHKVEALIAQGRRNAV